MSQKLPKPYREGRPNTQIFLANLLGYFPILRRFTLIHKGTDKTTNDSACENIFPLTIMT